MARYLITSALPYINGIKHLGNLAGSMLPADVFARFQRLRGHDVLFICATDEHGTPAELAAAQSGESPREYCDRLHEAQKSIGERFALSFDWFGRSSSSHNHALTRHFARKLESAGLIEEKVSEQMYSPTDKRFLPDRYVEGICPHCGHDPARGDQCDGCGRLLDPTDLHAPRSVISGTSDLQKRKTRHLFLLQSNVQNRLRAWIDASTDWPSLALSIARKWLDEGLRDRAITRDLAWGIPVCGDAEPRPGFEHKVFYVWFDAPIEYIAATAEWAEAENRPAADWRKWWRTDQGADNVTYVQFMGKDNVAFHTVGFPTTLIGSGEAWKLVDRLKAFNWLTWYGGKFSTTRKRGVFMNQALDLMPSDCWRWFLTANAPENADTAFTWKSFQTGVNSDLANVLGNLVNRITRYCTRQFNARIPEADSFLPIDHAIAETVGAHITTIARNFDSMEYRKSAAAIRALWSSANAYLTSAAPWSHHASDPERAATATRVGLNIAAACALVAQPVIPHSANVILDAFGVDARAWPETHREAILTILTPGNTIKTPALLFEKISDDDVARWEQQFGAPVANAEIPADPADPADNDRSPGEAL